MHTSVCVSVCKLGCVCVCELDQVDVDVYVDSDSNVQRVLKTT